MPDNTFFDGSHRLWVGGDIVGQLYKTRNGLYVLWTGVLRRTHDGLHSVVDISEGRKVGEFHDYPTVDQAYATFIA